MTLLEAQRIAHTLSFPSKMPCPAWGISAKECRTGQKLRQVEGTACSTCYVFKGRYIFPTVVTAHEKRLASLKDPGWADAMTRLISIYTDDYFRWFDSGDIQGAAHYKQIKQIAENLPKVKFWLPTQEYKLVKGKTKPDNLIVRVSSPYLNKARKLPDFPTSSVHFDLSTVPAGAHICPADSQGHKCLSCRACWDTNIQHVAYIGN